MIPDRQRRIEFLLGEPIAKQIPVSEGVSRILSA